MGKVRYGYGIWSNDKDGLKSRSEVPTAANITASDGSPDYIDCVNISLDQVRGVIGESTYSLYNLCRSDLVNRWSEFCPVVRSFSGSTWSRDLVNSKPTVCALGDFAGYNHGALTPGWQSGGQAAAEANIWYNDGGTATVSANICIGEIDWYGLAQAEWVVLMIFDSTDGIQGWAKTDIATVANNFTISATTGTISGDKSGWYGRLVICDTEGLSAPEDVESAIICRVPNTSTFAITLKAKAATSLTVNNNGLTVESAGFNTTAGTCGFTKFYHATNSYSNVHVEARLVNWLGAPVGSTIDMHNGAYSAPDEEFPNITATAKPNGDPIPSYGYTFIIDFYLTS